MKETNIWLFHLFCLIILTTLGLEKQVTWTRRTYFVSVRYLRPTPSTLDKVFGELHSTCMQKRVNVVT